MKDSELVEVVDNVEMKITIPSRKHLMHAITAIRAWTQSWNKGKGILFTPTMERNLEKPSEFIVTALIPVTQEEVENYLEWTKEQLNKVEIHDRA